MKSISQNIHKHIGEINLDCAIEKRSSLEILRWKIAVKLSIWLEKL